MLDLLWRLFEKTGTIGCYLLYKAVEKSKDERYLEPSFNTMENTPEAYQIRKESI
ncbi:MAG: YqzL family protein [Clostridiales bacterium]|jgi:hypothetical protein|nr:YqzL family protein [Clostridiales bacterium]